jgi:hypothetical protein
LKERALEEMAFCEAVVAKAGLTVLGEALQGVDSIAAWKHYPPGDVFDPGSGAQWYYHCHPAAEATEEHGHFHCFVRPSGSAGPIHHLIAIGMDTAGRLHRLFTVNQWVVGDDWADAATTIPLLKRFDVQMPRPSYLVNRWLTAVLAAHETEIVDLIQQRDAILAHDASTGVAAREDRALEVVSEFRFRS